MEKGRLIEFRLNGERRLAVADRPEGKKNWVVIDEGAHSHTIKRQQITYEVAGEAYTPSDIPRFLKEVGPYLDPSNLEVAWELLVEAGEAVTPEDLAQLLYSDQSPPLCYAAHCLLVEDKLYFKQKGDRYEPRPSSLVAEIQHQKEVQQQRQQEAIDFLNRINRALAGEVLEWTNSDRSRLEAIEKYAIHGNSTEGFKPSAIVGETLTALNRPDTPQACFDLLVTLGLWSPHENLFLRRSQIPTQFSTKVLEVAQGCLQNAPDDPDSNRLDLTHLKVYTIDDESTTEIDDGLSIEYLENDQTRVWIHIADPTRWLTPGDELDLDARRRGTTIYTPTGMISMFPSELATGPMSLIQGKECCALSFGVILDSEGAIADYTIHATLIKPTYRLTYDDVEEMLHLGVPAEPEIATLAQLAKLRQTWRTAQGAINISMPEASIKVKDDEVTITLLEDAISRQLVAEMMILAGEVTGRYGSTHQLPFPFRSQPQPELPPAEELMQLPAGPVRSCALRRCMPRSEMSITPARHASLGLDFYTQVTSPIRRYMDLLTHFQLKAHLRGDPLPFSEAKLQELMAAIAPSTQEANWVERQTNRYWGLEFLRRHLDQVWQGLVLRWLRENDNLALVLLEELGLEMAIRFTNPVAPGDYIELKVTYADPREDVVHFQHVLEPAALES
ncbi:ribonuclease R [Roseofilum reptotaenium CS-1145]|uniref:RNB domain-containing ribonuclease n=1 Tax=Roseofilum reptotaenium AO1-A TaxID=1925591 RepID=A0A1L9QPC3_9CYAN|nr:ribonuclease R family protein [Roseofilum reptotaenium]MDB9520145.1 ribonuclease R [Roseofilum reptotaenium CS-1145]OJJ24499.1 RNB domain-containing ribonuclease [Roseofilum reptotaenium AO1-A]